MNTAMRIFYTDAYYSYEKDLGVIGYYESGKIASRPKEMLSVLSVYDAYGFVEKHGDSIVVAFIKKKDLSLRKTIRNGEKIIEGLIIPDTAILSRVHSCSHDILEGIKNGIRIAVTWRDVVTVANLARYDCSIMYTEGTLYKIEKDHIVLKDTETIRVHPMPAINHPAGKPMWYIIPISFIKDIEVIS